MKRITKSELEKAASVNGLALRFDCGGCRVIHDGRDIFPDRGICPTVTRREALHFITGYNCAKKQNI